MSINRVVLLIYKISINIYVYLIEAFGSWLIGEDSSEDSGLIVQITIERSLSCHFQNSVSSKINKSE